jgi:hypothetical protein
LIFTRLADAVFERYQVFVIDEMVIYSRPLQTRGALLLPSPHGEGKVNTLLVLAKPHAGKMPVLARK